MDDARAATIIQRNFRKYLSRVKENQNLISKVNTENLQIRENENYDEEDTELYKERIKSIISYKDNRNEKLWAQTVTVYEELQRFYKNLQSSRKCDITVDDLVANIKRKISVLRGVSSLEKWHNISFDVIEDKYKNIAGKRHEKHLLSLTKCWWELLD